MPTKTDYWLDYCPATSREQDSFDILWAVEYTAPNTIAALKEMQRLVKQREGRETVIKRRRHGYRLEDPATGLIVGLAKKVKATR